MIFHPTLALCCLNLSSNTKFIRFGILMISAEYYLYHLYFSSKLMPLFWVFIFISTVSFTRYISFLLFLLTLKNVFFFFF